MTVTFGRRSPASKPTINCSDCGGSFFLHTLVYDGVCDHVKEQYGNEDELVTAARRVGSEVDEAH